MSEVSYPRSRPRTRPPLPRDPVPTSPPRNPIRASVFCLGDAFRGAGANPAGSAPPLRQDCREKRPLPSGASRSRFPVHMGSLPAGIDVPRHRQLASLRPLPERQGLCRAVHPHTIGARIACSHIVFVEGRGGGALAVDRRRGSDVEREPACPTRDTVTGGAAAALRDHLANGGTR